MVQKQIKCKMKSYQKEKYEIFYDGIAFGSFAGFLSGLFIGAVSTLVLLLDDGSYISEIKSIIDLDNNGIKDQIIIHGNGYQTPIFGYQDPKTQETIYVTGTRMEELFLDSSIDYQGIEARLNEK